jgi:hypothetical protein
MARPFKKPEDRKNVDLRIPVTAEQKRLIMDAVALDDVDMAAWARTILLAAARRRLEKEKK